MKRTYFLGLSMSGIYAGILCEIIVNNYLSVIEVMIRKKATDTVRLCADDVLTCDKLIAYHDSYAQGKGRMILSTSYHKLPIHHMERSPKLRVIH